MIEGKEISPPPQEARAEMTPEKFKEGFRKGIDVVLGLLELASELDPDNYTPLVADPSSMGFDKRTVEEVSGEERDYMKEILFEKFGIDSERLDEFRDRDYQTESPEQGTINVLVLKTNKENIFLQRLTFKKDGQERFMIGPNENV